MGRIRGKKQNRSKKQITGLKTAGDVRKGHVNGERGAGYPDIIKENSSFETFYKAQKIVSEEEWKQFMECLRSSLPTTFRITGYKSHAKTLLRIIQSQYFNTLLNSKVGDENAGSPSQLPWYPDNFGWQLNNMSRSIIRKSEALAKLHTFLVGETESGYISRQEAVSMIPPLLLNVETHHKILDMCAAPGSKTAQLIEMLHKEEGKLPDGVVVANDMDNRRCYMLVHQAKRLQSPCFLVTNHDASMMPSFKIKNDKEELVNMKFDRVLCDVPCSGDGTIRKNYDVWKKWNIANANNLHHLQLRILKRGLELLETGGRLVYSTCSLNPIENEAVICEMLKLCGGSVELLDVCNDLPGLKSIPGLSTWKVMTRELEIIDSAEEIPVKYKTQMKESMFAPSEQTAENLHLTRCMRILPHHQDTGGFFVAVFHKTRPLEWEKEANVDSDEAKGASEKVQVETFKHNRKKRRVMGYKEDPFFFFKENDPAWLELKNFYNLDDFADSQLLTRCDTGRKRNIYFVSAAVKQILENNQVNLKIINSGLRLFCRADNKGVSCGFRVTQEGIPTLLPYVKTRLLEVTKEDVANLLTKEYPPIEKLCSETLAKLDEIDTGSVIMIINTKDICDEDLRLELCGWKGKSSLRCYLPRSERIHYLRLCNVDISKYEFNPNKKFKIKISNADDETDERETMDVKENNDRKEVAESSQTTDEDNGKKIDDSAV